MEQMVFLTGRHRMKVGAMRWALIWVLSSIGAAASHGALLTDSDNDGYYLPVPPTVVAGLQSKIKGLERDLTRAARISDPKLRRAKLKIIGRALKIAKGELFVANLANSRPDCNDAEPASHPGEQEIPDGIDNNCNGVIDEGFTDADQDGYYAEIDDCNDLDSGINPGMTEVSDGKDNDCNGQIDDLVM